MKNNLQKTVNKEEIKLEIEEKKYEPVEEALPVEVSEAIEEAVSVEEPLPVEETEAIEESEPKEQINTNEETESLEVSDVVEETEEFEDILSKNKKKVVINLDDNKEENNTPIKKRGRGRPRKVKE